MEDVIKEAKDGPEYMLISFDIDVLDPAFVPGTGTPEPVRASGGKFDRSTRSFTFKGPDFGVVVRFDNPDRFTAETVISVNGREHKLESYRFTRN